MNSLLAAMIAGFCGLMQLIVILVIETENDEKSGLLTSDDVFPYFALLVMTEIMCIMALSIYRISPWLLRVTGEKREADRVSSAYRRYGTILARTTIVATLLRRGIVMIDTSSFSTNLTFSLLIPLTLILIPRPKLLSERVGG